MDRRHLWDFIARACMAEVERLEREHSAGRPWEPIGPGQMPPADPWGSRSQPDRFCSTELRLCLTLSRIAIKWTDSAAKHGLPREDVLNAMANYVLYLPAFDEPRVPGRGRPDLFVGPPVQRGGALIEVMVERVPPRTLVIFHAVPARVKFLALLEEGE